MRRLLPIWAAAGLLMGVPGGASAQDDEVHFEEGPSDKTYAIPHERARGEGGGGGGSSRSGIDDGGADLFGAGVEQDGGDGGTGVPGGSDGTDGEGRSSKDGDSDRGGIAGGESGVAGLFGEQEVSTTAVSAGWMEFPAMGWFLALMLLVPALGAGIGWLFRHRANSRPS